MKKFLKLTASVLAGIIAVSSVATASVSAATVKKAKISVKAVATGVKISWKKVKSAKKYVVQRKLSTAVKYSNVKTLKGSKTLSFIDTKAKSNKKYTYRLKTVNGKSSALSDEKTIDYLAAPKSVKAKVKTVNLFPELKVSWKKVTGAKKYEIYRAETVGKKTGKYSKIATIKKTSFTDYDVFSGLYNYKIKALNGSKKSAYSTVVKTGILDTVYPYASMNPSYTAVRVRWSESSGASAYKIYRAEGNSTKFKLISNSKKYKTLTKDGEKYLYYDDTNVKIGTKYTYYITAYAGKIKSFREKEFDTATVKFNKYDGYVEVGDTDTSLSGTYNMYKMLGMSLVITSSNDNILTVETTKNSDNSYTVALKGISEGYADVTIKGVYQKEVILSETSRFYVTKEPIYELTLKKGATGTVDDLTEVFETFGDLDATFEVKSDKPSVVKVNNPTSKKVSFTGVSAGEATISVKATAPLMSLTPMEVYSSHFKIKVTE